MMRQIAQNYNNGQLALAEVELPLLRPGGVLVRSAFSVISIGTEGMKVREAKMSYLEKARARPDQVKKVLESARTSGIVSTYQKVMNKLDSFTPLGYSLSGEVVAVGDNAGEFEVGQRVACAGAEYAHHAEFNFVPKNLVVPVPHNVQMEHAAFATIGAIAMHGFRQSEIRLGESAVVVGLGLVGQILVRILAAAGVRVFGIDVMPERCALATEGGAEACGSPTDSNWQSGLRRQTSAVGADCVFLTVGSNSNAPLEQAVDLCRDRGRIVCVGKTKLDLDYNSFFRKEVDVRFSRSYGPGRYDPSYENKGIDYPIGYVRWTERRNMESFLDLIAQGKIDLAPLIDLRVPFDDATEVYNKIHSGKLAAIGVLLQFDEDKPYPPGNEPPAASVIASPASKSAGRASFRLGVIGLGNYAGSMLMPHLKADERVVLAGVATATPLSAANAARKYEFAKQTTSYKDLLSDPEINAVLIATRHQSHAQMAVEALEAGKAVFVEKPLAIDEAGLKAVAQAAEDTGNRRVMVGFNRRYAPIMQELKARLTPEPVIMTYRVQAGALPGDAWINDPAEGSRFIGEAGHFLDVFSYLTASRPLTVSGNALRPSRQTMDDLENIVTTVRYENGSIGCLIYSTQGGTSTPKERLEVLGGGETLIMDNFTELLHHQRDGKTKRTRGYGGAKGQAQEMAAFASICLRGRDEDWAFEEIMATSWLTLRAEQAARDGSTLEVGSAPAWTASSRKVSH